MIGGDLENLPEGIDFEAADCNDLPAMKRLTKGVDVIFHTAAIATEGLSVFSPALIATHVYTNTATVLAAAATNNVKRFVHCSSMARFGNGPVPFVVDLPLEAVDHYGICNHGSDMVVWY